MASGRRNGERVLGSGHLIGLFLGVVLLCCVFYTLGYVMGRSQEASTVRAESVEDSGTVRVPAYAAPANVAPSDAATGPTATSATGGAAAPAKGSEWDFDSKKAVDDHSVAQPAPETPAVSHPETTREERTPTGPDENLSTPSPSATPITAVPASMARTPVISKAGDTSGEVSLPSDYQPPRIPRGSVLLQVAAMTSESDALAMASVLHKKQFPAFVVTPTGDKYYRVQVGPYKDAQSAKAVRAMLDQAGFKSIIKR